MSDNDEGDELSFSWSVNTSNVIIANAETLTPSFSFSELGVYDVTLSVSDGEITVEDTAVITVANQAPTAVIWKTIDESGTIKLDGSQSSDPEDTILDFSWSLTTPNNSQSVLSNTDQEFTEFLPDEDGIYSALLTVTDSQGASDTRSWAINFIKPNLAPNASAGSYPDTYAGIISLNGTGSSDPDGDDLLYLWTITHETNEDIAIQLDGAEPELALTEFGTYTASLTVRDPDGLEDTSEATITVINRAPVAMVISETINDQVILDGNDSSDEDNVILADFGIENILNYSWTIESTPDGVEPSSITIIDANSSVPTFTAPANGTYTVKLIVSDGFLEGEVTTSIEMAGLIDEVDVATLCQDPSQHQSATIFLDFASTQPEVALPNGAFDESGNSNGQCNWIDNPTLRDDGRNSIGAIQGYYKQSPVLTGDQLPENAVICSSSLTSVNADENGEVTWYYDDEIYLTLEDHVLVSSDTINRMAPMSETDNDTQGIGPYLFDFNKLSGVNYDREVRDDKYCLGQERSTGSNPNPNCTFPKTQQSGVFNIEIPEEEFTQVSADVANAGELDISLIVTGDDNFKIDCQHSGIEMQWDIKYVVNPNN